MKLRRLSESPINLVIIALFVIGIIAAPFFSWLTMIIALSLIASVAVLRLGILGRLMLSVVAYGMTGAMALQITTVLHVPFSFKVFHIFMLLVACVAAHFFAARIDLRTSVYDVAGFVVGLAVFLAIAMPLFGASTSKTLQYLLPGEDNQSHLQMYRYIVNDKKYAYNNAPEQAGIRPTLISYAQGSHAALATVTSPFVEGASQSRQLRIFAFAAAATFAMMFWAAFLFIARPLAAVKRASLRFGIGACAAFLFLASIPTSILLSLYTYGYFPQYSAYLCLTVLLLLVAIYCGRKAESSWQVAAEVASLLLGVYAVFSTWYLLVPVIILPLLCFMYIRRAELFKYKRLLLAVAAPFVLLLVHLAYVFLVESSGASHVLTTGGVEKMHMSLLIVCLPVIPLLMNAFRRKRWFMLSLGGSLLIAAAFAALIGLYQLKKLGHYDYYFYKTLFTVLYLAALYFGLILLEWITAAIVAVYKVAKPMRKVEKSASVAPVPELDASVIVAGAIGVITVGLMIMFFSPPLRLSRFVETAYALPQTADARPLDVFTDDRIYERYSDAITLNNCNPYTNFTGTIWAGTFFLSYNPERQQLENSLQTQGPGLLNDPKSSLLSGIAHYAAAKKKPVALVLSNNCVNYKQVEQQIAGTNLRLVFAEGTKP